MLRFLRFFFHQLYHGFAWTYDFVAASVSIGRWRGWVLTALPYLEGPRVLELGHGPGHLQLALFESGLAPLGLDASRQNLYLDLYGLLLLAANIWLFANRVDGLGATPTPVPVPVTA